MYFPNMSTVDIINLSTVDNLHMSTVAKVHFRGVSWCKPRWWHLTGFCDMLLASGCSDRDSRAQVPHLSGEAPNRGSLTGKMDFLATSRIHLVNQKQIRGALIVFIRRLGWPQ